MTAADRQARSRAARAAAGCVRVSVTLSPEAAAALERLVAHRGDTVAGTIAHALTDLDARLTCTVRPYPARRVSPSAERFGAEFVAELHDAIEPQPRAVFSNQRLVRRNGLPIRLLRERRADGSLWDLWSDLAGRHQWQPAGTDGPQGSATFDQMTEVGRPFDPTLPILE